jgi:hypothetical protein
MRAEQRQRMVLSPALPFAASSLVTIQPRIRAVPFESKPFSRFSKAAFACSQLQPWQQESRVLSGRWLTIKKT